jgi:hypothetical protein
LRTQLAELPWWLCTSVVGIWPAMAVAMALGLVARNGAFAARRHGVSVVRQFVDQLQLAFADGVPPIFYYLYELHDPARRLEAGAYIHRSYLKPVGLYRALYSGDPERERRAGLLMRDKIGFHEFCTEHGLATPRLYVAVANGEIIWKDSAALPEQDLFVKLQTGKGGRDAELWTWRGGSYVDASGHRLPPAEFADHLRSMSRGAPRLVQECLANHPDLADLTAGALSTMRMYTVRDESGAPEHIFSMLRMSQIADSPVDNVHRGGIAAAVDAATGTLGKATDSDKLARTGWLDTHPVTGARIEGRAVPFWAEAVELVLAAHRQLEPPEIVGWDVAITEQGPQLIEANKSPDIEIEQRLDGPWGNRRFGQLLAYHLSSRTGSA